MNREMGKVGRVPRDSEQQVIPVRGCMSVAEGVTVRGHNPREGIHTKELWVAFEVPPHR